MEKEENIKKEVQCGVVVKFFKYLKTGPGLAILSFILISLGYAYMYNYTSYFNVNVSFYEFSAFRDFFILMLALLLLLVPMLLTFIFEMLIYYLFRNFKNIKNVWKRGDVIKFIIIFIILILFSFFWYTCLCSAYQINNKAMFLSFVVTVLIGIGISAIIGVFHFLVNSFFEGDMIDLIFIITIFVSLFLILITSAGDFGEHMAEDKTSFMVIDNEYVVLYNTSDYGIVSKYEIDNENKETRFLTNETFKIDLSNRTITYKDFKYKINIIR